MPDYISALPPASFSKCWPRNIVILGSTGSIGTNTLDVIAANKAYFNVTALAGGKNIKLLAEQALKFTPPYLAVQEEAGKKELEEILSCHPSLLAKTKILVGQEGYATLAALPDADVVLSAQVGAAGLRGTWAAVKAGKVVALANKESLVLAGHLMRAECARSGAAILPVDSEHNAIFQCIMGQNPAALAELGLFEPPLINIGENIHASENVSAAASTGAVGAAAAPTTPPSMRLKRLILTASGGPFRGKNRTFLATARKEDALTHPTWSMGAKITIDSATLMNKGLEVIEACHLYGLNPEQVDVLVHPQSVIHSFIEYQDNSQLAQLGVPDMRIPISNCLGWPYRLHSGVKQQNLLNAHPLSFEAVNHELFPALQLCKTAYSKGADMCIVLNAANEIAVHLFLNDNLSFNGISALVAHTLAEWEAGTANDYPACPAKNANGAGSVQTGMHKSGAPESIEEILNIDQTARELAMRLAKQHQNAGACGQQI